MAYHVLHFEGGNSNRKALDLDEGMEVIGGQRKGGFGIRCSNLHFEYYYFLHSQTNNQPDKTTTK